MIRQWSYSLSMFAWLTIGYAVVHIVIAFWGISIIQGLLPQRLTYEGLQITEDGETLIASWGSGQQEYRHTDGTPVTDYLGVQRKLIGPTLLTHSDDREPRTWKRRIFGVQDFQRPTVYWYFIAPLDKKSGGYFTGYEELTRRRIGYLDSNGFTNTQPVIDHLFPVKLFQSWNNQWSGTIAGVQLFQNYGGTQEPRDRYVNEFANAEPDSIWILSEGKIYEIRLGLRTIRTLVVSRPDFRSLNQHIMVRDHKSYVQLIVRTDTGLVIIDPQTKESESLLLDPVPPQTSESLYQLHNGQKILVLSGRTSRKDRSQKFTIIWIDAEGQLERRTEVNLLGYSGELFAEHIASPLLCAPLPLIAFGAWLIGPIVAPEEFGDSSTYSGLLQEFFWQFKVWIVISLLIGIGTGWACRRRERDVFGRSGWFWPILVGLCGWFGWMGYICLRPLPARLSNGHWLPSQPEPIRPLGTEIFA